MNQQYEQLSGKTIVIIGAGNIGLQYIWKTLHDYKLKIILIDTEEKPYVKDYIYLLIKYNYKEGSVTDEDLHANNMFHLLGDRISEISACFAFDDYLSHLAELLGKKLRLLGISPLAAKTTISKKDTYDIIGREMGDSKLGVTPSFYCKISSEADISQAKISYPAILKPEFGSLSEGVTLVSSEDDCIMQFNKLQRTFAIDWFAGKFGNSMILMELLHGSVYQLDLIIFRGDLLKCIVGVMGPKFRDLGPPFPCVFSDTTTCYHSCLPLEVENDLIASAFKCCQKIGLNNGVYNVEMVLTNSGFRLLEINCRCGSFRRCSAFRVTLGIDLWIAKVLISCGIKPILPEHQVCFAVGCYLYSFIHRASLSTQKIENKIHDLCEDNEILYIKRSETMVEKEDAFPKPFAHIVALDEKSVKAAKIKLINICNKLRLSNEDFDIEKMTETFC